MKMLFRFSLLLRFRSFVHSLIRRCYEYFLYFFSTFPCLAQLVLGWRYMNSEFLTAQSQFPIRLERRKTFFGDHWNVFRAWFLVGPVYAYIYVLSTKFFS